MRSKAAIMRRVSVGQDFELWDAIISKCPLCESAQPDGHVFQPWVYRVPIEGISVGPEKNFTPLSTWPLFRAEFDEILQALHVQVHFWNQLCHSCSKFLGASFEDSISDW